MALQNLLRSNYCLTLKAPTKNYFKLENKTMKKTILISALCFSTLIISAQVEVSSKSFDLESQNKHKNWRAREAGIDAKTGNVYVKMLQPSCDITKSSDASYNYTTFNGLKWNIDKLIFDANFNYIETQAKTYESTKEALLKNENVFGKKYNVYYGSTYFAGKGQIDNSFMFSTIVAVTAGYKVATSRIGLKATGQVSKTAATSCGERAAAYAGSNIDTKEEKGQTWIPFYNNPVPNGGNILFDTYGVLKEEKQHFIFRKYDENATVTKEKTFTFDYQCVIIGKEIEIAPGVFDYVFVTTPIKNKKSKIKIIPANNYEYFLIDGATFEIKEQLAFTAPNSNWMIDKAIHKNGTTYLIGGCSEKNTDYVDFYKPANSDNYENVQVVKIENGKLAYAKSIMNKDLKSAFKTAEGLKSTSNINFYMSQSTLDVVNSKLIYGGQQLKTGSGSVKVAGQTTNGPKLGALQVIVFNENGDIDAILSKQTSEQARAHISFSKDGKKLFWLLEDVGRYNSFKDNMIYSKKSNEVVTSLSVLSYDLEAKEITKFQNLENDEWAVNYNNPILMEDESSMILLGNKITKKAKDSEIVFITIKK